jgi:hypothetical protein
MFLILIIYFRVVFALSAHVTSGINLLKSSYYEQNEAQACFFRADASLG